MQLQVYGKGGKDADLADRMGRMVATVVQGQAEALGAQFQTALTGIQSQSTAQLGQVIESLASQHQATIAALTGAFQQSQGQGGWQGQGQGWPQDQPWQGQGWGDQSWSSQSPQSWGSKPEPPGTDGAAAWHGQGQEEPDHDEQDWGQDWPANPPGLMIEEVHTPPDEDVPLLPLAMPPTPPQPKWPAPPPPVVPAPRPMLTVPFPPCLPPWPVPHMAVVAEAEAPAVHLPAPGHNLGVPPEATATHVPGADEDTTTMVRQEPIWGPKD